MTLTCKEAFVVSICRKNPFSSSDICWWRLPKWVGLYVFLSVRRRTCIGVLGIQDSCHFSSWDMVLLSRKCHNGILCSIFLLLSEILDI